MPKMAAAGAAVASMFTNGVDLNCASCVSLHANVVVKLPAVAGTVACDESATVPSATVDLHRSSVITPVAPRVPYSSSSLITDPRGKLGRTLAYPEDVGWKRNWPSIVEYDDGLESGEKS